MRSPTNGAIKRVNQSPCCPEEGSKEGTEDKEILHRTLSCGKVKVAKTGRRLCLKRFRFKKRAFTNPPLYYTHTLSNEILFRCSILFILQFVPVGCSFASLRISQNRRD